MGGWGSVRGAGGDMYDFALSFFPIFDSFDFYFGLIIQSI